MEGKSFGKKKRCWYIPDKNLIYCFNCGRGFSPYNWIKDVGNLTYEDIRAEVTGEEYTIVNLDKKKEEEKIITFNEDNDLLGLPDDCINLFDENELLHYKGNEAVEKARKYIYDRRLLTAVNKPSKLYFSLNDFVHKNRIIFPFFESSKSVPFYQSRSIGANPDGYRDDVRYLSKCGAEKSIFNYDKIRSDIDDIYVFEGPIDSCFCRNGVAVAGITGSGELDLTQKQRNQLSSFYLTHRIVWMLDSQYLDETARKKTEELLKRGENVFIWPEKYGLKYKDFNEWCIEEDLDEVPLSLIRENIRNTYVDSLEIKFKKDWIDIQSNENDFYGNYVPFDDLF